MTICAAKLLKKRQWCSGRSRSENRAGAPAEQSVDKGAAISRESVSYVSGLDDAQILDHVRQSHALWGDGMDEAARFSALRARLQASGPALFSMAGLTDAGGGLRASLKRYFFDLAVKGRKIKTVGLGAIFTDPQWRGRGFAQRLIRAALDDARDTAGCGAALLFSDIGSDYYERLGFAALPAHGWKAATADLPAGEPLALRPTDDIDAVLAWHRRAAADFALSVLRTPETFALFSAINDAREHYLLFDGAREVGAITMKPGPALFWVDEWYAPGMAAQRVWATVAQQARASGRQDAGGWWLPWYGIAFSARQRAVPMLAMLDGSKPDVASPCLFPAIDHF